MQALAQRRQGLRRRVAAEDAGRHIPRQDLQHEEDDERDDQQGQEREQDPFDDQAQDLHA